MTSAVIRETSEPLPGSPTSENSGVRQGPIAAPVSVLVVDDRPGQTLALAAVLGNLGHNIVRAHSGTEALRHLLDMDFAVILLDVQMPILDGFETATLIRQRERSRSTPIIFLTGVERSDSHVFQGYALGAVDYVLKPVVPAVIRAKVTVFVELARKTRLLEEQAELLRRAHQELVEAGRARARLLDDLQMSTTLAGSLDFQETVQRVADLAATRLADWCMIDIVAEGGETSGSASSHADPEHRATVAALHGALSSGSVRRLSERSEPELVERFRVDSLPPEWQDEERLSEVRACGLRATLSVPLAARGRVIGVMTLGSRRPWPSDATSLLELAVEFALRASLAIDNARLYRAAEEAVRARDDFLCAASHELRTPLTPLMLQADALRRSLLRGDEPSKEWLVERVSKMRRQCVRLEQAIAHLLDVSRISAQKLTLELGVVDLAEAAAVVVERAREELGPQGAPIRLLAPEAVTGSWDRFRIEQVITNLLSNAIKYGEGQPIEVTVGGDAGSARLMVRDQGIGIPVEQQGRIFGRFERATAERRSGGLGLGLWIVSQIATAHGGTIRVQSAPGQGATFTVELPRNITGGLE